MPPEWKAELIAAFTDAVRRGRDPAGPEKAAEVVREYERQYGEIKTKTKLGRSKAYPRLLLMAYALGRDGRPFAFANHRIGTCVGLNGKTVRSFTHIAIRHGYFSLVRDGVPGRDGLSTWFRLHMKNVEQELGLDGLLWPFKRVVMTLMR